uniref:Aminotransferase-like protein n=1 Tax=Oryza sativa subsp. japonica TaxID=39947 RepID=Q2QV24_ORYSJ|nr:hypothetical protein LOC_Os12g14280 [Oryza sativa Japonica Group]
MSSSASPSATPSASTLSLSHENYYFLGPVGNPDPTEFFIGETNRIPFRLANPDLGHWKNTFKSWPSLEKTRPEKSWITWFKSMSASKRVHWDEIGIGQALDLTIANSAKDEPLMATASYFWSNTINAFLFNQGPMTPTLIDIIMITGLDVTLSANSMSLNTKNQYDFKTKSIGGWSGYVAAYMGQGSVTPREHVAFLLMWLEKFLFCGSSCGPTTNWQFVAEALEAKKQFPLRKILLGYLYQMLNNASAKLAVGSVVGAEAEFPRLEPIVDNDGEERTHRRCTSYGEYASIPTDAEAKLSAELLKDWFCNFYEGFQKHTQVWFLYEDSTLLENPLDFIFEDINNERYQKPREISSAAISPYLFPDVVPQTTEFSPPRQSNSGRNIEYASGLIPNGGGPSPPVIGYDAPKTSALLQGLIREPADAGKKRKTRSSAVDTSAPAPKKKTKTKITKPSDDLPALDPSIEQALDEEEIEEDVDQAAAKSPPPSPVQQSSSDQTPSAVGIHHVEEEVQPTAPAILKILEDISHRLEASSLDSLVVDCGSIRTRLHEIQALIPDELADVLTPAVYLEQHQFKLEKAKLRLVERRERKDIEATI